MYDITYLFMFSNRHARIIKLHLTSPQTNPSPRKKFPPPPPPRESNRADALYFYYILLFRFFIILLVITILPFVYVDYFSYLYKIY